MTALYRKLARQLAQDIRAQRWRPGQRLPALRRFARQQDVSITTALQCYRQLESEGLVQARPQSGFYVCAAESGEAGTELAGFAAAPGPVANIREIERVQDYASRPDYAPLGTSLLSPDLVPLAELQRSLHRSGLRLQHRLLQYGHPQGDEGLREALALHFSADGLAIAAGELLITNGCTDAVALALRLTTEPGDVVAVPSPCFSGLLQLIGSLGRQVVEIPLQRRGIDLTQLQRAMGDERVKACLLSANHHNPLGFTLAPADKRRIARWAEQYQCPVIEDDVFGECGYTRDRALPIRHWDNAGWVLWCGSFSKTLAPAYRIGWCAPGRYTAVAQQRRRAETLGVNLPLQAALADFVRAGHYRRHLQRLRPALIERVNAMRALLQEAMPEGCRISRPDGGFVLWLTLPEPFDGMRLFELALEERISIVPGQVFSSLGHYRNGIRINCGWPLDATLRGAIERLGELAGRCC